MCLQFIKEVLPGETSKRMKEAGQGREEAKPGAISGQVPQTWLQPDALGSSECEGYSELF